MDPCRITSLYPSSGPGRRPCCSHSHHRHPPLPLPPPTHKHPPWHIRPPPSHEVSPHDYMPRSTLHPPNSWLSRTRPTLCHPTRASSRNRPDPHNCGKRRTSFPPARHADGSITACSGSRTDPSPIRFLSPLPASQIPVPDRRNDPHPHPPPQLTTIILDPNRRPLAPHRPDLSRTVRPGPHGNPRRTPHPA